MKYTKYLFFLFIALFVSACSDDKNEPDVKGKEDERPETLAWIEDTMRERYYWRAELDSKLNYGSDPETFFYDLLNNKDGKWYKDKTTKQDIHSPYSYIKRKSDKTRGFIQDDYSYGFEFVTVNFQDGIGACILYVLPNSPASGKLERGDWILEIDKKALTNDNTKILFGGNKTTFTIAQWDSSIGTIGGFVDRKEIEIDAATKIEDNPIFHYDLLERNNNKIGYLIYNHFTAGKDDEGTAYDDELRNLSGGLFNGVNEFILDLRYNNGGLLQSAKLLCAIFTPSAYLNQTFGALQYKYKDESSRVNFTVNQTLKTGRNLNLKRLYVLVSSMSASSSEAVINLLNPFMEVILIGETTEGKNVGSIEYTSEDKVWEIHPIVCEISNSKGFTDYASGFEPNYSKGDAFDYNSEREITAIPELRPLGDENERLLNIALGLIEGTYTRGNGTRSSEPIIAKKPKYSLERKATNGVIINN